jgi:hypothetical protein
MTKKTSKQGQNKAKIDLWIEEENLKSQARKIRARIKETAQIGKSNFWEYIAGSFPEVSSMKTSGEAASGFAEACYDAVMNWYLANAQLDQRLLNLIKGDTLKAQEKRILIGQNAEGWWAANPEPAIKAQDIDKVAVIFNGIPSKDELLDLLSNLGYKKENIIEGILRL